MPSLYLSATDSERPHVSSALDKGEWSETVWALPWIMMQSRVCLFALFSLGHHTCPEISLILAEAQSPWILFTKPHLSCYCYAFWFSLYILNSKRHYSYCFVLYIHLYLPTHLFFLRLFCFVFHLVFYISIQGHFSSARSTPSHYSFHAGLLATHSPSFHLLQNIFILPSFLKDVLLGEDSRLFLILLSLL